MFHKLGVWSSTILTNINQSFLFFQLDLLQIILCWTAIVAMVLWKLLCIYENIASGQVWSFKQWQIDKSKIDDMQQQIFIRIGERLSITISNVGDIYKA
jgi:hypothetical protein